MRFPLPLIAMVVLLPELASFGQVRHVTLTLNSNGIQTPQVTNELQLAEFETAELVSHSPMVDQSVALTAIKDGVQVYAIVGPVEAGFSYGLEFRKFVMSGPARIRYSAPASSGTHFATFRVTPEAFPPDRTIITMPGTNQTSITLECSTNLVQWVSTTNGVYGPMPEAKFFRIKAQPAN